MKSLRGRLLVAVGLIMVLAQAVSIAWVWHESREQIDLLVEKALETTDRTPEAIEKHIQNEVYETIAALSLPALVTIVLALLLVFAAVTRLTRPLRLLVKQIQTRTPYHLQALPMDERASTEIQTVTQTINQLLGRLEQGMENERRFTADVAHELRTPLAGLRLNLELMAQKGEQQADKLVARIDLMMISIEQLLQLARAGQKLLEGHGEPFDLIADVISPAQMEWDEDPSSPFPMVVTAPPHAQVMGDSGLIYVLLRNLLENSRRYAPQSAQVDVRVLELPDGAVTLEVLDEGPGVPQERIAVLTQRFTRLDQTQKGHGLGLNIAGRIAQVHQALLEIENRRDHTGLLVRVRFPAPPISMSVA